MMADVDSPVRTIDPGFRADVLAGLAAPPVAAVSPAAERSAT